MAKIKFLGAAGMVTGSSFLLESNKQQILVDLGLFQGPDKIDRLNRQSLVFDARQLNWVLLTHAHLDHCGRLPLLVKSGFQGKIYMTAATRDLLELALFDSAKIGQDEHGAAALFSKEDVIELLDQIEIVVYNQPLELGNFKIVFRDAGHILGAASIEIFDIQAQKDWVFSGDLGNSPQALLKPTQTISQANYVVMESTYGYRLHPQEQAVQVIQREINEIESSNATLLIPAFSLQRTQELLHLIDHMKKENRVRINTPVFLDSPMATLATEIYLQHQELFNQKLQDHLAKDDPFDFPGLYIVRKDKQSQKIHTVRGAKVIIAGSGMMTGGRILRHAVKYLPEKGNRLLIVGYQGEETLGRKILDGARRVEIEGKEIYINAHVSDTQAMSAHADQGQLLNWLKVIRGVEKVFLIHGDEQPRQILARKIKDELGISDIVLPQMEEEVAVH